MHKPHSSGVRRITHFVRVEVVMIHDWTTTLGVQINIYHGQSRRCMEFFVNLFLTDWTDVMSFVAYT